MKKRLKDTMRNLKDRGFRLYIWVDRSVIFPFYRKLSQILDRKCEEKIKTYGLVSDWKEQSLKEFRLWLADMPEEPSPEAGEDTPSCDLYTLLAEFAGLRNEIKLQNREQARAVKSLSGFVDSCSETFDLLRRSSSDLQQLERNIARFAEKKCLMPFFDVRDTLVRSMETLSRKKSAMRLFLWGKADLDMELESCEIALRKFDRALAFSGITPVETLGKPFDPKTMKAVGVVTIPGKPGNLVVEQVNGGYLREGELLVAADVVVTQLS